MRRRTALALAAAALLGSSARAERPLYPLATDFPPRAAWLNATGLSLARFAKRKATLIAFLNPSSPNSLRAVPALKAWFERYALSQLMVVAVLTPDMDFQKDPAWAKRAVERMGLEFPVVLDPDRRVWRSYGAEGWPAFFLVDAGGRVVYDKLGEGGYKQTERELRAALAELSETLPPPADPPEPRATDCGVASKDLSLGARRGARTPAPVDKDEARGGRIIVSSREGELVKRGKWDPQGDSIRLAQPNRDQGAFLRTVYAAPQAFAVLSPPESGPARVYVKQDDIWLHAGNAGKDVRFDPDGRSYVRVDEPRLYELVREPSVQPRELYLFPVVEGVGIHSFSFADACQAAALP